MGKKLFGGGKKAAAPAPVEAPKGPIVTPLDKPAEAVTPRNRRRARRPETIVGGLNTTLGG